MSSSGEDLRYQAKRKLLLALNRKPLTIQESRKILLRAEFPEDIVESVVAEAEDQRWLDDESFAKLWVEDRVTFNPKGTSLLARELRQKGVDSDKIDTALDEADIDEEALIDQLIEQKRLQYDRFDPQTRERRMIGMLKRRGFSFQAIRNSIERYKNSNG